MKKVLVIISFILVAKCSDVGKTSCWGCTEETVVKYSNGTDTSFFDSLPVKCSYSEDDIKALEAEKNKTTVENIANGVIKTTTVHFFCTDVSKIK